MATKQTQKKTSAKKTTRKPAAKKGTAVRTKKTAVPKQKKSEFSYAMSGIWVMVAGVLLAIFTYGSAQGVVVFRVGISAHRSPHSR